jgi:NADP-dependent 3-hydroxy acid dehydrogenase YdfG
MTKFIGITEASKGISRAAADALVEQGWSVIGVARSSPPSSFPEGFIQTDLAYQNHTRVLVNDLAARADVFGIVKNVGVARHEAIDAVEPDVFAAVMDLNVRPALQLTQALLPAMRAARGVAGNAMYRRHVEGNSYCSISVLVARRVLKPGEGIRGLAL